MPTLFKVAVSDVTSASGTQALSRYLIFKITCIVSDVGSVSIHVHVTPVCQYEVCAARFPATRSGHSFSLPIFLTLLLSLFVS